MFKCNMYVCTYTHVYTYSVHTCIEDAGGGNISVGFPQSFQTNAKKVVAVGLLVLCCWVSGF